MRLFDRATCSADAQRGKTVRQSHSRYSSKQSLHVLTVEYRSRPHGVVRSDAEKALRELMRVVSRLAGTEVMDAVGSSVDLLSGAAYAIDGHRSKPCTSGQAKASASQTNLSKRTRGSRPVYHQLTFLRLHPDQAINSTSTHVLSTLTIAHNPHSIVPLSFHPLDQPLPPPAFSPLPKIRSRLLIQP